jgi:hypothetical protein
MRYSKNPMASPGFDRFDGLAVRRIADVRVDVERRRDARVPELLLRAAIVQGGKPVISYN